MAVNSVYINNKGDKFTYPEIVAKTQRHISHDFSHDIAVTIGKKDEEKERRGMRSRIERFLINEHITAENGETAEETAALIYEDMGGLSVLAKYLNHLDDYPTLEEINVNAWNSIVLKFSGGKTVFTDDSFLSPSHSVDIIKKIAARHDDVFNDAKPWVTTYITENIRVTALKYPAILEEEGINASIRITRPSSISETKLVNDGTVSQDIIDFLFVCIKYTVSLCVAGKMGSGKTTFLNYLLSQLSKELRIYQIEEGSRELSTKKYDMDGRLVNQVVSTVTVPDQSNEELNIDSSKLLEIGLRFNADYIVPQEMRSKEAYVAVDAGGTGSAVITSIHSNTAKQTPSRIVRLMQKNPEARGFDKADLMEQAVEAFPLIIYMRKLGDEKRRVMEVLECEKYTREKGLVCRTLFHYAVDDNIELGNNKVKVIGHFEKVYGISEGLQRILLNNGAPQTLVKKYAESGTGVK